MLSTSKVEVSSTGTGLQVKAGCRGFEIVFDEPVEMGGTDEGMNPVEGLLCALGACQSIAALVFAGARDVSIENVNVEVEGDIDPDGFMGKASDVRNGLQEVRVKMRIKSSDKEAAARIAKLAEGRCPVGDCLRNPVPIVHAEIVVE